MEGVRKQRVARCFCRIASKQRIRTVAPLHTSFSADSSHDYVYGPSGVPIEQVNESTGAPTYFYTDQLGSVVMEADLSGSVIGTQSYSAYGSLASSTGSDPTPFGYAGGYTDATGLIYLVHRYYDPSTGQFVSVDPLVSMTGEAYGYTYDNPVNQYDPMGLDGSIVPPGGHGGRGGGGGGSGNCGCNNSPPHSCTPTVIGSTTVPCTTTESSYDGSYLYGCGSIDILGVCIVWDGSLFISLSAGLNSPDASAGYGFVPGVQNKCQLDNYLSSTGANFGGYFGAGGEYVWENAPDFPPVSGGQIGVGTPGINIAPSYSLGPYGGSQKCC